MIRENGETDYGLKSGSSIANLLVLALVLLFAALSIALIVLGSQVYQSISERSGENAALRATTGYVFSRVQAFDEAGAIEIETMDLGGKQTSVLVFREEIEDEILETRVFCADGMLREQTAYSDMPLEDAMDAEPIASLSAFDARMDGNMLVLSFTHMNGEQETLHAVLHSGGEGAK